MNGAVVMQALESARGSEGFARRQRFRAELWEDLRQTAELNETE